MSPPFRRPGKSVPLFPILLVLVAFSGAFSSWLWMRTEPGSPEAETLPAAPKIDESATVPEIETPAPATPADPAEAPGTAAQRPEAWVVPELEIALVRIEPGSFDMGPDAEDPFRNRSEDLGDGPPTRVTLASPYWIGITEITRAQYAAIMSPTNPPQPELKKEHPFATGDVTRLPAVNMTWDQATDYCRRLTELEQAAGRMKPGLVFALPTEAQWEYACRARTATRNYAGDTTEALLDIAWFAKTAGPFTRRDGPQFRPVALKKPNAWGLHDMLGNVREWTRDWYAPLPGGSVTNWTGPEKAHRVKDREKAFRVTKGGCWLDGQRYVGSGVREWTAPSFGANPDYREGTVGFRIAAVDATELPKP